MATYYSDMVNRDTCVYRFYDADENLLYVGLSMNLNSRLNSHRRTEWWTDVVRCDVEWFEGREPARVAERRAILDEAPIHNRMRPTPEIQFRDITDSAS